ncbi:hypothetical protein P8452_51183 [Trifolium repens]|nr:hypothetical protein P8452_51183 [Trifolium repens]
MHEFKIISDSLVVNEVYEGSPADKVGVRSGDSISVVSVNGKKFNICGLHEYVELLNVVSDMLSACRPNQTDTMVYVSVNYDRKVVRAENLSVDDKNFCSSWLVNDSEWTLMKPLIDSIGINANVPMYSIHVCKIWVFS